MQYFNQVCKNKARMILWKKNRKNYDPKIETVKHLELINQNKIFPNFKITSEVRKFPGHASSNFIFNIFLPNFRF